jgi:hypothetical protein
MIRHPVTPGDPMNIPAGTVYNQPADSNRRFYSDQDLPANSIGIHPFNFAEPDAGDPVAENATGLLLRYVRWMLEVIQVDGFRIDAAKHMPSWFLRDFCDRHVWQRGQPDLAGNPTTPYSFMEIYDGNPSLHADYVCKNGQGNCNTTDGVTGNRDTLDFPLYFAMQFQLNGTGLGSWESIINASVDAIFDGNANNGSFGVQFVGSHDQFPPAADNLAYAYVLMRTGSPIVYFRGDEFGSVDFPKPGRGDALGGQYGNLITTLVNIHNEYAQGTYIERRDPGNSSFADVLVFERNNSCLVSLNDRMDNGSDQRTLTTNFPAGLRLKELTGNATDPQVDPYDDIFDVVTVGAGGSVTIRVPRNRNPDGVQHNRGYVIYGPFNPVGDLTLTNVSSTIAADPPSKPNGTRRLTPIDVITADSFEACLETTDADPIDDGEDDRAMLRMDAGLDINGNGHIDSLDPSFVGYGYEDFLTQSTPLKSGGVVIDGVTKDLYRQTIDATDLSDGRHYLSVIAFRSRPAGSPPIFQAWRKVFLLDRVPPAMQLVWPAPGERITSPSYTFVVRCTDRAADSVHMFLDQPGGTDVIALARQGQGQATQTDRDEFRLTLGGLTKGLHGLDVVAFEETGRAGQTTFGDIRVALNGFDIPDWDGDGDVDQEDFGRFQACLSGPGVDQTDASCAPALLDGDSNADQNDLTVFLRCFTTPNEAADISCLRP